MTTFKALRIHQVEKATTAKLEQITLNDLSPGEVVIRVAYSSVNYKDALAVTGKGRILKKFPLVPGIDLAGHVESSTVPRYQPGDAVLVTGCNIGEMFDGGYAEFARVSADSIIRKPAGLSLRETMALGTAGFTAALALYQMIRNGQTPDMGSIVVTGATGGVGSLAIDILTRAGFEAHAITGKIDHFDYLQGLGARQCIARKELHWGQRPLETAHWAGAIDNVGGDMLAGLTRVIKPYGNIAICGNAGGIALATTVMPFIIRGLSLLGVASAGTARSIRDRIWEHLAGDWKPVHLDRIAANEVGLDELGGVFATMIEGGSLGRTVVRVA